MRKITDRFIWAEFQAKGQVHFHVMKSVKRSSFNEDYVFNEDPEVLEKVKEYVAGEILSELLNRDWNYDTTHTLSYHKWYWL